MHDHSLKIGAIRKRDGSGAFIHLALDRSDSTWGIGFVPSVSYRKDTGASANLEINLGPYVTMFEIGAMFKEQETADMILREAFPSQQ